MESRTYLPLNTQSPFSVEFDGTNCGVVRNGKNILRLNVSSQSHTDLIELKGFYEEPQALQVAVEYLLGHLPETQKIVISKDPNAPEISAFRYFEREKGFYSFERTEFFQLPGLWHGKGDFVATPELWTETQGRSHPIRFPLTASTRYKRYVPQLGKTISFRIADPVSDLDLFYQWHHQARVADFWDLKRSREELGLYLKSGLADPHQIPMILEFDEEPVGYFEIYWASEDRLGAYYEAEPYDRGFHFLIGNEAFLGFKNTDAVLKAVCHFLFLDDPRTRRIMAEPRHDNHRVLKYAEATEAWRTVKIFDFPHKRAALLECSRKIFFTSDYL